MRRQRFKITQGQLASKLADQFDILAQSDDAADQIPRVPLSLDSASEATSAVRQSTYVTRGISYRVSSLDSCFETSHTIHKVAFLKRKTLIMINGLTRTKDHWVDFDKHLAQDLNVVTLDTRGVGESRQKAHWNLSIEQMSEDVRVVCDDLQIQQAFILGFSLGGMVALMFGLRYPKRVHSLIVINSSMGGGARSFRLYPQSVIGLTRSMIKGGAAGGQSFHQTLSKYVLSARTSEQMKKGAANLWADLEKRYGKNILMTLKQLYAASRFRDPRKLLVMDLPTLVIFGQKDHFVPSSHSAYIFAHLNQVMMKGIEEGGHELHFDKPHELKATLIDFMTRDWNSYS